MILYYFSDNPYVQACVVIGVAVLLGFWLVQQYITKYERVREPLLRELEYLKGSNKTLGETNSKYYQENAGLRDKLNDLQKASVVVLPNKGVKK